MTAIGPPVDPVARLIGIGDITSPRLAAEVPRDWLAGQRWSRPPVLIACALDANALQGALRSSVRDTATLP